MLTILDSNLSTNPIHPAPSPHRSLMFTSMYVAS